MNECGYKPKIALVVLSYTLTSTGFVQYFAHYRASPQVSNQSGVYGGGGGGGGGIAGSFRGDCNC